MTSTPPLLRVERLSITGPSGRLVDNVSLCVGHGRTLALIGESGSGKSLTALSLMGLLPPALSVEPGARVALEAQALPITDERAMRAVRGRRIAMVFQDPMACLNPYLTIGFQIDEALMAAGERTRDRRRERRDALLGDVELSPALARRYPHELSGGQQQRVMTAIALAGEPKLLVADEPTSALDATIAAEVIGLLRRLQAERRMAMLFITHDLGVASALAHDIAVMKSGAIVEHGAAATILAHPAQPYTQRLVSARQALARGARHAGHAEGEDAPAATVSNLTVDYPGRGWFDRPVRAVDAVSLSVPAGRTLGIVGESGSGKSTLAGVVAGLRRPSSGDVQLLGTSLAATGWRFPPATRRACQIIFQNPAGALNPRLTVASLLAEPLGLAGLPRRERRERAVAAVEEVGLKPAHLDRYPHELSGGQRQRVCIARALLSQPRVLVCDEVVSALDMTVQVDVLTLLRDLQERRRFAMLFIGHDLDVVGWISDEVAVMHKGAVVEIGPAKQVLGAPTHPYTRRLLASRTHPSPSDSRADGSTA